MLSTVSFEEEYLKPAGHAQITSVYGVVAVKLFRHPAQIPEDTPEQRSAVGKKTHSTFR